MPDNTDLVKIIRDLIRQELSKSKRTQVNDIRSIGDMFLNSGADLHLNTDSTHKAYYNGTEIVAMSAPGDVVKDTATNNKLLKWTNASTKRAGNSNISDDGTNVTITLGSGGKLVVTS